jgi:6-pyruvoyltetrahydropterin/6-carboxytetrahydropterin synthase
MHGHSYCFEVAVRGPVQTAGPARGMIQDFDEIERIVDDCVLDALDHRHLNEYIENPTVENIVLWIWQRLEERIQGLDEVVLWETATACAVLRRSDFPD